MKSILAVWPFYLFCIWCVRDVWSMEFNTVGTGTSRATLFVPRITHKVCLIKPDIGPCRGTIPMFYFDPGQMDCFPFQWGGCMGNGNRFDTKEECLDHCKSKAGDLRHRPKWCMLKFDYGFCFGSLNRWYYDSQWKVCKKAIYSGCGGNLNNFYNPEQCDQVCRFGNAPITTTTRADGLGKKVIIINPWNTTPKKGLIQTTMSTASTGSGSNNSKKAP